MSKTNSTINYLDNERCEKLYTDLVAVFQKHRPTIGEILIAYGNLGYTLGASIGGYDQQGPSLEELQKLYYTSPERVDIALMIQGITTTTWLEDLEKISKK